MKTSNKLFNVNISDELREKLREEAFKRKTTLSETARFILDSYFKENNGKENVS